MPLINRCGGGVSFASMIVVTYTAGGVCTCTNGSAIMTAPDTSGSYTFTVRRKGTWTINVTSGGLSRSKVVTVSQGGEVHEVSVFVAHIYGISRDITNSSPNWARTDDAVGFTATASVGTVAGSSNFDNCYPWSGITRETISTGDVMVRIPKFWYRRFRDGNIEHIQIADGAVSGFAVHPAFTHAGIERDSIFVGAYVTSSNNKSVSGASPTHSTQYDLTTRRTYATEKGSGWGLLDISTLSAIQMLVLVEFATNNVASAISSNIYGSSADTTGACDSVPNLTGTPASGSRGGVVWRGIENLWAFIYQIIDGVLVNENSEYCVCNNPSDYSETSVDNYMRYGPVPATMSSGFSGATSTYVVQTGFNADLSYIMLASEVNGASQSTYACSKAYADLSVSTSSGSGYYPAPLLFGGGGASTFSPMSGIFGTFAQGARSYIGEGGSSRLIYIPQN